MWDRRETVNSDSTFCFVCGPLPLPPSRQPIGELNTRLPHVYSTTLLIIQTPFSYLADPDFEWEEEVEETKHGGS